MKEIADTGVIVALLFGVIVALLFRNDPFHS
jgi:hypothetical protein